MAGKPKPKAKPEPDDKAQSQRFVETARDLGVDESGEAFERATQVLVPKRVVLQKELKKS